MSKVHEMEHYMKCQVCGEYFDMRDLSEVFVHEHEGQELDADNTGKKVREDQDE